MISIDGGPQQHRGCAGPMGRFGSIDPSAAYKTAVVIKGRVGEQLTNVAGAVQTVAEHGATYAKAAANGGIGQMSKAVGAAQTGAMYVADVAQKEVKPRGVGMLKGLYKTVNEATARGLEKAAYGLEQVATRLQSGVVGADDAQHGESDEAATEHDQPEVDQTALAAEKKAAKRAAKIERRKQRRENKIGFAPDLIELHEKTEAPEQTEVQLTKAEGEAAKSANNVAAHGSEKVADVLNCASDHSHSSNDKQHVQTHSPQHPHQPNGADANEHVQPEVDHNALADERKAAKRAAKIERRKKRREMNNGFPPDIFGASKFERKLTKAEQKAAAHDLEKVTDGSEHAADHTQCANDAQHGQIHTPPHPNETNDELAPDLFELHKKMETKAEQKAAKRKRKGRKKKRQLNGFAPDFDLHVKTEAHDHDHQQPHQHQHQPMDTPGTPAGFDPAQTGHNLMSPQEQLQTNHHGVPGRLNPMMQGNGASAHDSIGMQFNPPQTTPQPYPNHGQFQPQHHHEMGGMTGGFNPSMQIHGHGGFEVTQEMAHPPGHFQPSYGREEPKQPETEPGFAPEQLQHYHMDHSGTPGGIGQRQSMAQPDQVQLRTHDEHYSMGHTGNGEFGQGQMVTQPHQTQMQFGYPGMPGGFNSMAHGHGSPAPIPFGTQPEPQGPHGSVDPKVSYYINAANQATVVRQVVEDQVEARRKAMLAHVAEQAEMARQAAENVVNAQHNHVIEQIRSAHEDVLRRRNRAIAAMAAKQAAQKALRNQQH